MGNNVVLAKKVPFYNEIQLKNNIRKTFGGKIKRGNRALKPDFGGPVGRRKHRFPGFQVIYWVYFGWEKFGFLGLKSRFLAVF